MILESDDCIKIREIIWDVKANAEDTILAGKIVEFADNPDRRYSCFLEQRAFRGVVIVLGSAIADQCGEDSDVDICLKTYKDVRSNAFFEIYGGLSDCLHDGCENKLRWHSATEFIFSKF